MKISAAAFTLLSLCHAVVDGVIQNPPSLRGAGQQQDSSYPQFPAPGSQRERRLEKGGYIILFEDTVEDVEDFAIKLADSLGKNPDYIMKNAFHGVYMTGLSDADVEFLPTVKGVGFIEQNHFMDLFEGDLFEGGEQPQEQAQEEVQQEEKNEIGTKGLSKAEKRRRRKCKKNGGKNCSKPKPAPQPAPAPAPRPSPVPPPVQSPNRQPVPWNILRVKGPITYTGPNKVWILDTGIMLNHPDLNVDRANAYNVFTRTNAANDDHGHGTQCAGIIAAIDNSIGTVGVAAGATVVPIKVFDSTGGGSFGHVAAGLDYVASKAKKGDVVNMSLGGPADGALDQAVKNLAAKGVIIVVAAGNSYVDAQNTSPARIVANNVYTISAMNQSGRFSGFSNYGSVVDYACPGEGLKSTHINGGLTDGNIAGTSFAAPHAAGVFLLGNPSTYGNVAYDPDGKSDPCLVHGG